MAVVSELQHIENCNCGIYCIINPNNKIYVGSSRNIKNRFNHYKNGHCKNQHKLYNSFNKYGIDSHKFMIIKECSLDELYKYEHLIGIELDCIGENGLNIQLPSYDDLPWIMHKDARIKISLSKLGKKRDPEVGKKISMILKSMHLESKNKKAIICYDIENNMIDRYKSATDAAKILKIHRSSIVNNLNNFSKLVNTNMGMVYFKYETI